MEFNTEPIIIEMNKALTKGLNDLLANHLERYNLLEKTHEGIMDLPSVRKHLSLSQINESELESETIYNARAVSTAHKISNENKTNAESEIVNLVRKELAKFVSEEINELKMLIQKIAPQNNSSVDVVLEKENIKLEIEDTIISVEKVEEKEEEAEEEEEDEEEEEEDEEEEEEDEEVVEVEVADIKVVKMAADTADDIETEEEEEEDEDEDEDEDEEEEKEEKKEDEEEDEEFFEIEIDNISYYTNNEDNGFIYEVGKDEELGKKVGYLKEGEPFFN
jgi:hypothetical protein